MELCTAATTEARGAATAALRGATRATLRGAATTEAPGAATAALRGVEVVVLVWTLVDQQMVNGEGFVAWRCGGVEARGAVNGEESKRRTAQNGDDALWRKTEKMNSANGSTVRHEREEVGSRVCAKNITSVIFPTDLIFKTISFF